MKNVNTHLQSFGETEKREVFTHKMRIAYYCAITSLGMGINENLSNATMCPFQKMDYLLLFYFHLRIPSCPIESNIRKSLNVGILVWDQHFYVRGLLWNALLRCYLRSGIKFSCASKTLTSSITLAVSASVILPQFCHAFSERWVKWIFGDMYLGLGWDILCICCSVDKNVSVQRSCLKLHELFCI